MAQDCQFSLIILFTIFSSALVNLWAWISNLKNMNSASNLKMPLISPQNFPPNISSFNIFHNLNPLNKSITWRFFFSKIRRSVISSISKKISFLYVFSSKRATSVACKICFKFGPDSSMVVLSLVLSDWKLDPVSELKRLLWVFSLKTTKGASWLNKKKV